MKRVFILFLLSVISFSSSSQKPAGKLSGILNRTRQSIPADQVFLHIDRNLFHSRDTIRFQAYIRDRQTGIFETGSISLYVLLTDALNKTIDSARFRIVNSTSSGWLSVPDSSISGDYNIVAFTGKMMNYNPEYAFKTSVRIEKIVPGKKTGLKNSPDKAESSLKTEEEPGLLKITFLPEGGTFVYGVKQRLAFDAASSAGTPYRAEGKIINQKGEFICDFRSGESGPGIVEFTPLSGDTCFATAAGAGLSDLKWQLPVPEPTGIALRTYNTEPGIIGVQLTNAHNVSEINNSQGKNRSLTLALIMNNSLVYANEVRIDSIIRFKINTEELPVGTAGVILFDDQLKPVAERLVFVNYHKRIKAGTSTSVFFHQKGGEAELSVRTTDHSGKNVASVMSVSVIDSASGYCDEFHESDIESEMFFDRDFYNNLPDRIKNSGVNNLDRNSLDLLLMTYGWRKFKTRDPEDTTVVREIINYDYLKIREAGQVRKKQREINLVAIEGAGALTLQPDASGEAVINYDSLGTEVRQIMILPDKKMSVNNNPLAIIFPEHRSYVSKAKQFDNLKSVSRNEISFYRNSIKEFGGDTTIKIGEVLIRGAQLQPEKVQNKYQVMYQNTNSITLTGKDFKTATYFEDILVKLHPFFIDPKAKKVYVTMGRSGRYSPPALIVVDDNPLWGTTIARNGRGESDYAAIADMSASNISSVTMIRGVQGFALYGEQALGGVIFVTTNQQAMIDGTYEEVRPYIPDLKNPLAKPIRIFRSEIEFYVPTSEQVKLIPEYSNRPSLFWANELIFDGEQPVKINYPNNLSKGTVIVVINGVTFGNIPFSSSVKYSVK